MGLKKAEEGSISVSLSDHVALPGFFIFTDDVSVSCDPEKTFFMLLL